jgi:hypothetical protein
MTSTFSTVQSTLEASHEDSDSSQTKVQTAFGDYWKWALKRDPESFWAGLPSSFHRFVPNFSVFIPTLMIVFGLVLKYNFCNVLLFSVIFVTYVAFVHSYRSYIELYDKFTTLEEEHDNLEHENEDLKAKYMKLNYRYVKCHEELCDLKETSVFKTNSIQHSKISPRNVVSVSSKPFHDFSACHASAEGGNREYEDEEENDHEEGGSCNDEGSDSQATDDEVTDDESAYGEKQSQRNKSDVAGYKSQEFLTFYIGNLHYKANSHQVIKAVQQVLPVKDILDQIVIARTSSGKSRGCAFMTVRWKKYLEFADGIRSQAGLVTYSDPRELDKSERLLLSKELGEQRICGRRVFFEVARNQRRA